MLALTVPPPPVELGDDLLARLLNEDCDPDILAPPRPFVVPQRCRGNKALMDTFDRLHFLTLIHTDTGRTDFTSAEISEVWPGGKTNRQSDYLHALCELELVQVIGHRAVPNLPSTRHPAKFRIDLEYLRRASAPLVADYIRRAGIAPPKRCPKPAPGQLRLALPPAEDDARGASTPIPSLGASNHPQLGEVGSPQRPLSPAEDDARVASAPIPSRGASNHPQWGEVGSPQRPLSPEQGQSLPSIEGVVGGDVGQDVGKEVRERATPAPTLTVTNLDSLRTFVQEEIGQSLKELLAAFTIPPRPSVLLAMPETHEDVPPPPPDEPAVNTGPRATWADLLGRELTGRDGQQIAEHIRRYDAPSGGYGAYWLARAMVTASLPLQEKAPPLTLNYVDGILRRMARADTWTTAELVRQPGETLREAAPPPTGSPAESPPVARGKPRPSQSAPVAPSSPALPEHPAIAAYTAAFGTRLNAVQTQQITATITNLEAWTKVLTDWQANGWKEGGVAKMIDRYQKETGTAPTGSESPLTAALIYDHPDLSDTQRDRWLLRLRHASTSADQRAVLVRFTQEHPDVRP